MDFVDQIQQIIERMNNGVDADDVKALAESLNALEIDCAGKQEAVSVIKMMHSLTKYLGVRMDTAYPGTLPALGTLAGNLESLLSASSVDDQAQILSKSKHTFKSVKSAIESGKLVLDSEMEELKAIILSVDWEISNITMKGFERVIIGLEKRLKFDKMHYTFLRIMHQVGAHIAKHKADAHQDAVSLLRWVFNQYEMVVDQPDMAPDDKKQLVQANIQAYKAFKQKIIDAGSSPDLSPEDQTALPAREIQPPAPEPPASWDNNEDNSFSPALSHTDKEASDQEDSQLVALDDPMTDPAAALGSTQGTGSTGNDSPDPQRDVMGDLFSMKESAADELLDAIHLSNIHGPDQENAAAMPGVMGPAEKKAGVQQVTSQRMDNTPIPEIESRLDAFFSLNDSDDGVMEAQALPDPQALEQAENLEGENDFSKAPVDLSGGEGPGIEPVGIELLEEPADASGHIAPVPDMQEDEFHLEEEPGDDEALSGIPRKDETSGNMPDREPDPDLDDLQNLLSDPDTLRRSDVFEQIQEKVASLNDIWAPDSDKVRLLDLVSSMARFIHQQDQQDQQDQHEQEEQEEQEEALPDTEESRLGEDFEPDDGLNGMDTAEPDQAQEKPSAKKKKGFFAGLKALFKG